MCRSSFFKRFSIENWQTKLKSSKSSVKSLKRPGKLHFRFNILLESKTDFLYRRKGADKRIGTVKDRKMGC
jgi:hypothetical protein